MSNIDGIHSCSYYCDHHKCIKAQRDELRDKYIINDAAAKEIDTALEIAEFAVLKEREACAKLCDAEALVVHRYKDDSAVEGLAYSYAAKLIRARGEV